MSYDWQVLRHPKWFKLHELRFKWKGANFHQNYYGSQPRSHKTILKILSKSVNNYDFYCFLLNFSQLSVSHFEYLILTREGDIWQHSILNVNYAFSDTDTRTMKYIRMVFNKTSADEILKKRLFQNWVNKDLQHLDRHSLWVFMIKQRSVTILNIHSLVADILIWQ